MVLGSHVGRSLAGILNGPKSDRLLVLTSEASQLVIFKVDCVTVFWISGGSVSKVALFTYFSLACLTSLHGDNKCGRGTDIRDEKPKEPYSPCSATWVLRLDLQVSSEELGWP